MPNGMAAEDAADEVKNEDLTFAGDAMHCDEKDEGMERAQDTLAEEESAEAAKKPWMLVPCLFI